MREFGVFFLTLISVIMSGCIRQSRLDYALDSAGSNRTELEAVLDHYRSADPNSQKLRAS